MIVGGPEAAIRSGAARRRSLEKRQLKVLALRRSGLTRAEIARLLRISERTVYRDLEAREDEIAEIDELIEDACATAEDAHLKLSKMFDARLQDLFDEQWNLLPKSQWPEPWASWGLVGEIKVEDVMVQDADGDGQTWRKSGGKRIHVKGPDPTKTIELLMRHRAVDGLATQRTEAQVGVTVEVAEILAGARSRARMALERVDDAIALPAPAIEAPAQIPAPAEAPAADPIEAARARAQQFGISE
jgi:hypothetical protein